MIQEQQMIRFGTYSWFGFPIPMDDRLKIIRDVGFVSTSFWWGDDFQDYFGPKEEYPEMARRNGLEIENVHLRFNGANEIWTDSLKSDEIMAYYMQCINECAQFEISTAVLHLTSGFEPPPPSQLGLDRILRLTDLAESKGVNIALENLRRPDYLDYVFACIRSDRLGFCFDSGHENYYSKGADLLSKFGPKLMTLHLHDNNGSADQHQVPGEGSIDWTDLKRRLDRTEYAGPIALEVTNECSNLRGSETPVVFLKRAFETAVRIFG
jgi:sugar phosphate isomerase/epimerase